MASSAAAAAALQAGTGPDPALRARLAAVIDDGMAVWRRFDREVRQAEFHPFMPANYAEVLGGLLAIRAPGQRFLEWGSATGVIAILADLIGFEAYGIELDPRLVDIARALAARHGSRARFAAGSLFPDGYHYLPPDGDDRTGTLGDGVSAYRELGLSLADFHVVYGYPWDGEDPVMHDVMRSHGSSRARLLLQSGAHGLRTYRGGVLEE